MSSTIEELDFKETVLGELILSRRPLPSARDSWVYEIELDGRFLMSSAVRFSEEALAERTLRLLDGSDWRVLVGGLGLGYTAAAALTFPEVDTLDVVEYLPEVIAWYERGLVPMSATLGDDSRCRIFQSDCFQWLRYLGVANYDAVLIDIDNGPEDLLTRDHGSFYTSVGLHGTRRCLRPGGMLGIWTSRPTDTRFLKRIQNAFSQATVEEIEFYNPFLDLDEVNAIYLARA
jgi:spermidine synthase